jgi:hypothetical protein
MADFADVVRHWMAERGTSLRGLAAAANYDPGLLSKVLNGRRPYSPYLAARLDRALGAGGEIEAAAQGARPVPSGQRAPRRKQSKAVEALQVVMGGDTDDLDIAEDGLSELVHHYAHAVATAPSAAVYDELISARSFAGTLLSRARPPQGRPDLIVATGWLSSLLAISATDIGDHAAALVWCSDTERRGRDARYPELLGWAALTRALIAYYQGDPRLSAAAARRGQADASTGTVAYAKLASQEMRCLAMLGDASGMEDARHRAAAAMDQLGPSAATSGVYSVPRAVSKWYHRRTVHMLRTLLPESAPFYAISWEPLYAGMPVTRDSWPDIPDGLRRVVRESREIPRRVADGSFCAAEKTSAAWRLC